MQRGSESIRSGRGAGGIPSNVTVPVMTPGPSAVSVAAGRLAGAAAGVLDDGSLPPPHAADADTAQMTNTCSDRVDIRK